MKKSYILLFSLLNSLTINQLFCEHPELLKELSREQLNKIGIIGGTAIAASGAAILYGCIHLTICTQIANQIMKKKDKNQLLFEAKEFVNSTTQYYKQELDLIGKNQEEAINIKKIDYKKQSIKYFLKKLKRDIQLANIHLKIISQIKDHSDLTEDLADLIFKLNKLYFSIPEEPILDQEEFIKSIKNISKNLLINFFE